ncbi:DEAD/DEAH box helicase family protein [Candidatus Avelusimicrobium luingense]|uniref:DEAD/DEAH box helicase family protein n=1 Tax=Candidatus Avelusimicrobium luingense TaxID=3416211 RepID=UPI003D12F698
MARKTTKKNEIRFADELILNRFLLNQIGFEDFKDLSNTLKPAKEGWKEDGSSYFYDFLINSSFFSNAQIDKDTLLGYDMNIARHTKAMQGKRPDPIVWKYFQWACLLFTEIFLDKFFTDSKKLLQDLNAFKQSHAEWNHIPPYTLEDINKVAVWNATGSGKTLLMHVNLLQYKYYLAKHHKEDSLNKILLITPNEGLSRQHLDNFNLSQISAEFFDKNAGSLFAKDTIQIIDINKLKEEGKVGKGKDAKTIDVNSFENNNLVFVDEAHKGARSDEQITKNTRDKLSSKGFAFEYSATLGQAVEAADKKDMRYEYCKCTLFDYSYSWFYKDGYGKDYRIMNLKDDTNKEYRKIYLTGCLLAFYQQLLTWDNHSAEYKQFNWEKPLLVFVGATVVGRQNKNNQAEQISDAMDILHFLADFVHNKQQSIDHINQLLENKFKSGGDVFANTFTLITKRGEDVYNDILRLIFKSQASGALHLNKLKSIEGEISMRIANNPPFGVINVGEPEMLLEKCQNTGLFVLGEENFSTSLFDTIKEQDSEVNVLIGSKKFMEGWDCFRVSTMGLMHVGQQEGSQIIQLFGRGVRLKGYQKRLKRTSRSEYRGGPYHKEVVNCMETLNIFGVKANYMEKFEDYLKREGMPTGRKIEFVIPVLKNLPNKKLKIVRLKSGVDFKKNGEKPTLQYVPYIQQNKVQVDWYPKIQALKSEEIKDSERDLKKETNLLTPAHLAFMDWERLYLELEEYKAEKSWYNLNLNVEDIKQLFNKHNDWYELYIPREDLRITSFADFEQVYDISLTLVKKYCDKFYTYKKSDWEKDKLEYCEIKPDDNNFIEEYKIYVRDSEQDVIARIKELENLIKSKQFKDFDMTLASAIYFDKHLYNPLLLKTNKNELLEVKPVPLNEGEGKFVTDLRGYCQSHKEELKDQEVYLLRNRSKVGIGFFEEGGFFPDFILWIIKGNAQRVVFIDPKGTRNLNGKKDPKIMFYQRIKEIERQLKDSSITLDSFILSVTDKELINWALDWEVEDFGERHFLFQSDKNYIKRIFDK